MRLRPVVSARRAARRALRSRARPATTGDAAATIRPARVQAATALADGRLNR